MWVILTKTWDYANVFHYLESLEMDKDFSEYPI